jgi:hypothetical protein
MAMITVSVIITKTVATLNGAAVDAILAWVQANIKDKLPSDSTVNVTFSINT